MNIMKWLLQGAPSTKASLFRGARSIAERRRVETNLENQRGGRRRGGLGRKGWFDRQCKCRFHLLSMILCCFNCWKDKTRQDKTTNEKMKVVRPPTTTTPTPHLKGCPVACCVSLPLHSIPSSSSHQHQGLLISTWSSCSTKTTDRSQNLWGKAQSFNLIWFERDFFKIRLKYWTV